MLSYLHNILYRFFTVVTLQVKLSNQIYEIVDSVLNLSLGFVMVMVS